MPRLPQQFAYYPHIIILAIQLQQRNLEPLRLDSTTCTLVINTLKTFQQGTLLHESHPRWHSCMCKKKVETGAGLLPLLPRWACLRKISSTGQVVHFFFLFFLSLNTNLTFFRHYDARR